ncbi:endonuclease/exonuclease/phosphatase family protein [Nocardioides aurantiacus]|uniref:endonuclease/exonuclease/phosphatase family protein n=1 Tax=Nocardioides aurantiacus TaxID=86796 RepID=UPI001476F99B|nr:endonuclease/exonuclease/phosphatase family protein [Nocardioides aurantiacus]
MVGDGTVLRVVTANAASGRDRRGRIDHTRWADAVAEAQHRIDADVWAVQEVDHRLPRSGGADQTGELGAALAADGTAWSSTFAAAVHGEPGSLVGVRPAPGPDPAAPSYGVALHSRLTVRATHELHLAPSRLRIPVPLPPGAGRRVLWVPDEPRVALAAEVDGPAGPVTVVTTHLSFAPWQARRQLRTLLAWAADLPRPLVLLGDLNLAGRAPGRVSGLPGSGSAPTYPSHHPRRRLDHVLLDAGGAPLALRERGTPRLGGSDHLGVAAEVHRTGGEQRFG